MISRVARLEIRVFKFLVIVFPYFNAAATTAFVDPFRAANYLSERGVQ